MPDSVSSEYLTPKEVAELLKVDVKTVYRLIRAGKLGAVHVGALYRISDSELERYLSR